MNEFHPKRILSPVDLSPVSIPVLRWAGHLAAGFGAAVEVFHADHVEAPVYFTSGQLAALNEQLAAHRNSLEGAIKDLAGRTLGTQVPWTVRIAEGPAIDELQKRAETDAPDLIVMGAHGRSGVKRVLMGSVAENMVRLVHCPVLIVPVRGPKEVSPQIRTVLNPVNFTQSARESLILSARVAGTFKAEVRVLHVVDDLHETESAIRSRLCSWVPDSIRTGCAVTEILRAGDPAEQILRFAGESEADLIVMAADHRPFLEWSTIGTTTIRVMRHSEIPVLIIPRHIDW